MSGYASQAMSTISELRIPAERAYVIVAKRAAAAFGSLAGFDIEAIDDLVIAISQTCENAIQLTRRGEGGAVGEIRLTFTLEDQRLEVAVRSSCPRMTEAAGEAALAEHRRRLAAARRAQHDAALASDLALRMMGLFVDDCHYRVDERTGGLRVRLTKYRAS